MEHVRTSALKAVVATLSGIPGILAVVPKSRWSYSRDHLPAINAHWVAETGTTVDAGRPGHRMQTRTMILRVIIVTSVAEYADDDPPAYSLDAWQADAEERLTANFRLTDPETGRPLVRSVTWLRTETGESEKASTTVVVTAVFFTVVTHHREGAPRHPLRD